MNQPHLSALAVLPGLGSLAIGVALIVYAFRERVGWRFCLIGALAWIVTATARLALAVLLGGTAYDLTVESSPGLYGLTLYSLYVGLLIGVT